MPRYHERAELAPRYRQPLDVAEMRARHTPSLLEMTAFDALSSRPLPKIQDLLEYGRTLRRFVRSSPLSLLLGARRPGLFGRSSLAGLYAAGEVPARRARRESNGLQCSRRSGLGARAGPLRP